MAMARVQLLVISKRRMLSATAICRPPPSPCILSFQLIYAGDVKFSFLRTVTGSPWPAKDPNWPVSMKSSGLKGATKDQMVDRYFKIVALIDARKSVEKKLGIVLHKCSRLIKQLKQVYLQLLINWNGISNCLVADKVILLSPDVISLDYANKVLMDLPSNPNLSSYNTLIKRSIGKSDKIAASAYNRMRNVDNISPDRFTLAVLLKSFASFDQLESGQTVHGHVIKLGFVSDTFVMNSLLDFYFKFVQGHLGLGVVRKVFEEMPERDIVSWNAMISGLVYKRLCYEALLVFDDMLLSADHQCKPNETTLINMVNACSHESFIEQGKWLGTYIKENKFVLSIPLGNALIDMFVRFNDLGNAKMVFKSMSKRCTRTWQMMMSGLVNNGFFKETLVLFDTMCCCSEEEGGGLKPNADIFSSVLVAFINDERLVGDGKMLFRVIHKIVHGFGVKPNMEHYRLMIKLLSEAGWVEATIMLAESLPWEPDSIVWSRVLYACQVHGNENLLDSWIRKIDDVNSKQVHPPSHFMKCTIKSYMCIIFWRIRNNNVSYAKLMVESLLKKLSDQELVSELKKVLKSIVISASTPYEDQRDDYGKLIHPRETLPPHKDDDVYEVVESLDRQLLDLHDQMINIINDPCQLDL